MERAASPVRTRCRGRGPVAWVVLLLAALALTATGCSGDAVQEDVPPATTTAGGGGPAADRAALAGAVARVRAELRGLPQKGLVLGNPSAPVTIIEYATFACPACAAAHTTVLPEVMRRYVRTGRASIEFRGIAGTGATRSRDLALSAQGAAAQDNGWAFVQLAYRRSIGRTPTRGEETSAQLAAALGLDVPAFRRDRSSPASAAEVDAAANVASLGRFSVFPIFLLRARERPELPFVVVSGRSSVGELGAAIDQAREAGG